MVTKTVTGNGTGDYNCDGTADDVEINQALAWAAANAQSTIYIKGPFTYDIQDSLHIPSYTTIQMDSNAVLRLHNSAGWAVSKPLITQAYTPIVNVEIWGGEIDGNAANQTVTINTGYYPLIVLANATNVNVHDMNMHDGTDDGLRVTTGSNIIFHTNTVNKMGANACSLITSDIATIFSNNIVARGNAAIFLQDTSNCEVHNNYITGFEEASSAVNGIFLWDTTGDSVNVEMHDNVILDVYGTGILIKETSNGKKNRNKHCHTHHNTVRRAGKSTIIDYNSGCSIQGFSGTLIEYNSFDSCYNSSFLVRYAPEGYDDGYCEFKHNYINRTYKHQSYKYQNFWSGYGISNCHPTKYNVIMENNLVLDSENENYYGVNPTNDIQTLLPVANYIPPISYIQDETPNYYVYDTEGANKGKLHTAYINRYPFNWQAKKIDIKKAIAQEKPPGIDGWCLEDFGFEGASITLDMWFYSFEHMQQTLAAFYQPGIARLELGDFYSGWYISGVCSGHSTDLNLTKDIPKNAHPLEVLFLADKPIMEAVTKKVRSKKLTSDGQAWSSEDVYCGNKVKNWNFSTWLNKTLAITWNSQTSAADNNWTSVCWGTAASGTSTITVSPEPFGICVNAAGTKAFVTCEYEDKLSVITLSNNSVSSYVVNYTPMGIDILPDDSKVYMACYDENSVSVYNTSTNGITDISTNIGTNPIGLAINAAGTKAYVANFGSNDLSVITISSGTATKICSNLGTKPYWIAITPNDAYAYVTLEGGNCVKVIQLSNNTVYATVNVGNSPHGIAINSAGTYAYVANRDSGTVSVIDIATNQVSKTIQVGTQPEGLSFNPDCTKVYVCNQGSNNISVINTDTNSVSATITAGSSPANCAFKPDGTKAYFTNDSGTSSTSVTSYTIGASGKYAAVSNTGTGNRVMTSLDGTSWTSRTSASDNNWTSVCFSADLGLYCAVANSGTGTRVMTSPDALTWTSRTSAADNDWRAVCASTATNKFVAVGISGTYRVMYSTNGTSWSTASAALAQEWRSVCWSAAKTLFVAVSYTGTTQQVMTSSAGSSWTARTTPISQAWTSVCYSPDLGMFAAVAENGTNQQVMTSTDGTTWSARTTPATHPWTSVCWNPNDDCFVAVASDGAVMGSLDGITWTMQQASVANNWTSVCYSTDLSKFVAVSNSGTGNRVMTASNCSTSSSINTPPTDWIYEIMGQQMDDEAYADLYSYMITADGEEVEPGKSYQYLDFEEGYSYTLGAMGMVEGLDDECEGGFCVDLFENNEIISSLDYDEDCSWSSQSCQFSFDHKPTDARIRIRGHHRPNAGSRFRCDHVYVIRSRNFEKLTLGSDISTTGTVDVVPDFMVTAVRLTDGAKTEGFLIPSIDTTSEYVETNTTYQCKRTDVINKREHKRHRHDRIDVSLCCEDSHYPAWCKVTYQCASLNGGAETQLCEFSSDWEYPDYETKHYSPFLEYPENEDVTIRYYQKSHDSGHNSHMRGCNHHATEIITNNLGSGIQIYNQKDPLTKLHVCNKLSPGSTMEICADGTGSFRYTENLTDITYQNVVYSRSGDTHNKPLKLLQLTAAGTVVYKFDTRYPITGIPYLMLDVYSGIPQVYIAPDNNGSPGSYYLVDDNPLTDQSGKTISISLDNAANLSLKGNSLFYLKITTPVGAPVTVSSLFMYADLITMDAQHPKIFVNNNQPNTFIVEMPTQTALEVSLQYRDAHRLV